MKRKLRPSLPTPFPRFARKRPIARRERRHQLQIKSRQSGRLPTALGMESDGLSPAGAGDQPPGTSYISRRHPAQCESAVIVLNHGRFRLLELPLSLEPASELRSLPSNKLLEAWSWQTHNLPGAPSRPLHSGNDAGALCTATTNHGNKS
jgi:hypothetical protein